MTTKLTLINPEETEYIIVTFEENNAFVLRRYKGCRRTTWQKTMRIDAALDLLCRYEEKGWTSDHVSLQNPWNTHTTT